MSMRSHFCGQLTRENVGQTVTLGGWINRRRDHGGVIFLDVRDKEGLVQVVCNPDDAAMFELASSLRNEFCVKITGYVVARDAALVNAKLPTGEIEVVCDALEILNPSVTPPFQLDEENLSETTRLTHRVLDLRRPQMQHNMKLRYRTAMAIRKFLDANDFIDIETPMLTKSTPEGARDYLVPSRVHDGQFFALPQSPQLFKQMLMIAGYDRYYQIVKCFRDEDLRADRQPEFTQVAVIMAAYAYPFDVGFGGGEGGFGAVVVFFRGGAFGQHHFLAVKVQLRFFQCGLVAVELRLSGLQGVSLCA